MLRDAIKLLMKLQVFGSVLLDLLLPIFRLRVLLTARDGVGRGRRVAVTILAMAALWLWRR